MKIAAMVRTGLAGRQPYEYEIDGALEAWWRKARPGLVQVFGDVAWLDTIPLVVMARGGSSNPQEVLNAAFTIRNEGREFLVKATIADLFARDAETVVSNSYVGGGAAARREEAAKRQWEEQAANFRYEKALAYATKQASSEDPAPTLHLLDWRELVKLGREAGRTIDQVQADLRGGVSAEDQERFDRFVAQLKQRNLYDPPPPAAGSAPTKPGWPAAAMQIGGGVAGGVAG